MLVLGLAIVVPVLAGRSGTQFVDANAGPNDLVIIGGASTFSYANDTNRPLRLVPTPTHQVGFAPEYNNSHVMGEGLWAAHASTDAEIVAAAKQADRVFVILDGPLAGGTFVRTEALLKPLGFSMQINQFGWIQVDVWYR